MEQLLLPPHHPSAQTGCLSLPHLSVPSVTISTSARCGYFRLLNHHLLLHRETGQIHGRLDQEIRLLSARLMRGRL
jgi:hypothetical protein